MVEIDKTAFGRFVAEERRRLGLTQKQLAQRLVVSDKAVSKWETGVSLPDIQLLAPLAELLEVSVAELLACRRLNAPASAEGGAAGSAETDTLQMETLLQRALCYNAHSSNRPTAAQRRRWGLHYALAAAFAVGGSLLLWRAGRLGEVFWGSYLTMVLLGLLFGLYFCLFVPQRLPAYYDEHRIEYFTDGAFRIHMTGAALNNRCWPRIVRIFRWWSLALLITAPPLQLLFSSLPKSWAHWAALAGILAVTLGGMFIPVYRAARTAEKEEDPQA